MCWAPVNMPDPFRRLSGSRPASQLLRPAGSWHRTESYNIYVGSDFPRPMWFRTGCFFSFSFFLHRKWPWSSLLDPNGIHFCTSGPVPISTRYPASAWIDSSHPLPTKQTRTASGLSIQGRMVIARPIWIRSVFVHLARFRYRCVRLSRIHLD